ncbi:MAG: hypothetical protein Q8K30_06900 [Candidatus Gracilibacteria bacterium]|nr:hypothetical protein [Candidatus Gracilibacteria bacterium]MDP2395666.1 hypothetical protein [bacterium]MDP3381308.1 hypothetical protein [bacterium]
MQVKNNASFTVIALTWHITYGYGQEVSIEPGETSVVLGPYIGEMGGCDCTLHFSDVTYECHEGLDAANVFHISAGNQCIIGNEQSGLTIRHYLEDLLVG